jgi:hypothetical protein
VIAARFLRQLFWGGAVFLAMVFFGEGTLVLVLDLLGGVGTLHNRSCSCSHHSCSFSFLFLVQCSKKLMNDLIF